MREGRGTWRERERERAHNNTHRAREKSDLVFYVQSTSMVISGRQERRHTPTERERERETDRQTDRQMI